MRTVEIEDATAPLSAYVREIRKGSVVVLKRGKAMAAVVFITPSSEIVASVKPRNIDPESPMKIEAGLKL